MKNKRKGIVAVNPLIRATPCFCFSFCFCFLSAVPLSDGHFPKGEKELKDSFFEDLGIDILSTSTSTSIS